MRSHVLSCAVVLIFEAFVMDLDLYSSEYMYIIIRSSKIHRSPSFVLRITLLNFRRDMRVRHRSPPPASSSKFFFVSLFSSPRGLSPMVG